MFLVTHALKSTLSGLALVLFVTSCNQQEFYQKEFLDGVGVPDDKVVDGGTTPDDPGNPGGGSNPDPDPTPDPTPIPTPNPTPTPGVCGSGSPQNAQDSFTQNTAQDGKVDILWVIDNSGSMGDEQEALAYNFSAFINDFLAQGIDFKMAITTTDGRSSKNGVMIGDSDRLTSSAAATNEANFVSDFQNWVRVGTGGSGTEQGLKTSVAFMDRYKDSFLRNDAFLVVVYLSDEQDQSSGSALNYANSLKGLKSNEGLFKAYSIVTTELIPGKQDETLGTRYVEVSQASGGTVSDIHQDFHTTLTDMGGSILNLLDSFPLSGVPLNSQIEVTVNGTAVNTGWSYDSSTRTVRFDNNSIPQEGSVVIAYYQQCVGGN
jgi:hypothetical protein